MVYAEARDTKGFRVRIQDSGFRTTEHWATIRILFHFLLIRPFKA